jgi:hypothetical protein
MMDAFFVPAYQISELSCVKDSVADPGCLSRIPDPDFYPSRIPDPKTATKDKGEKFCFVKQFFVATNKFHKTEYYFIFDMLKKKIWPNFPRITGWSDEIRTNFKSQ